MWFSLFAKLDIVLGKKPPTSQTQTNTNKQTNKTNELQNHQTKNRLHKKVKQTNLSS